jgi:hypothetical protein
LRCRGCFCKTISNASENDFGFDLATPISVCLCSCFSFLFLVFLSVFVISMCGVSCFVSRFSVSLLSAIMLACVVTMLSCVAILLFCVLPSESQGPPLHQPKLLLWFFTHPFSEKNSSQIVFEVGPIC